MADAKQIDFLIPGLINVSNDPLSGGSATFYEPGTTTLKTIWEDSNKNNTLTNPVTLDEKGAKTVFADGTYDVVIKDSAGNTQDNYSSVQFDPTNLENNALGIDAAEFGDGNDANAIALAIASAGGNDRQVYLRPKNWDIDADLTIPSNINLLFFMGAYATVATSKTMLINGTLSGSPLYNIFRGTGTVTIDDRNYAIPSIWPIGGTHDNSTTSGVQTFSDQIIAEGANGVPVTVRKNEDGANVELIRFDRTSASPADLDNYYINFYAENDNNQQAHYVRLKITQLDVSDGTEKGQFTLAVADGATGAMSDVLSGNVDSIQTTVDLVQLNKDDSGVSTEILRLNRTSSSPADNDALEANLYSENDNNQQHNFAQVKVTSLDVSDGTEKGQLSIGTANGTDGAIEEQLSVDKDKVRVFKTDATASATLLETDRVSASPVDDDENIINHKYTNDNSDQETFVQEKIIAADVSDGTESGKKSWLTANGVDGGLEEVFNINNKSIQFVKATDFQLVTKTTSPYTANQETNILVDTSSGSVTINLPATADTQVGRTYKITKTTSDTNSVIITRNGVQTINGATTFSLILQYDSIEIVLDGTNWFINSSYLPILYQNKALSSSISATDMDVADLKYTGLTAGGIYKVTVQVDIDANSGPAVTNSVMQVLDGVINIFYIGTIVDTQVTVYNKNTGNSKIITLDGTTLITNIVINGNATYGLDLTYVQVERLRYHIAGTMI